MRLKDPKKRTAIRNATVAEVIQGGLASVSIARIATRAGISAGTVYLYFPNKETLLQEVYLDIKQAFHDRVMAKVKVDASSAQNIHAMWHGLYRHLVRHPDDLLFSEQVAAARLLDAAHQREIEAMAAQMVAVLNTALADGTLKPLPMPVLRAILIAPTIHLARQAAAQGKPMPTRVVKLAFESAWAAVAKA